MSLSFTDTDLLKRKAKSALNDGSANIRNWWMRKYEMPPTHDLFVAQTQAALLQEMFEDLYRKRAEVEKDLDESLENREGLLKQLQGLNKALDEEQDSDDLFDEWEEALARGEIPDLDADPGG